MTPLQPGRLTRDERGLLAWALSAGFLAPSLDGRFCLTGAGRDFIGEGMARFSDNYRKWVDACILRRVDANGHMIATPVPGGKEAITSPQSSGTDSGNANIHEGVWWHTVCGDGRELWIFIPDPNKIVGAKSPLWTDFLVQDDKGYRYSWSGGDLLYVLCYGYDGD